MEEEVVEVVVVVVEVVVVVVVEEAEEAEEAAEAAEAVLRRCCCAATARGVSTRPSSPPPRCARSGAGRGHRALLTARGVNGVSPYPGAGRASSRSAVRRPLC